MNKVTIKSIFLINLVTGWAYGMYSGKTQLDWPKMFLSIN